MEDHGLGARVTRRFRVCSQAHDIAAGSWRVLAVVAAVEGADDLAEDAPDELLLAHEVLVLQVADGAAQISVAAVLHVQVQVLARFDVVALEVGDDVGMAQFLEDGQLGLQLLALLLRHLAVADLLAAEDVAIRLALDFSDDAKRAMSCGAR